MRKVTEYKPNELKTLGDRIRAERTKLGLSQEEFAGKLNLKKQQINSYETNSRKPDIDKLISIAKKLNVSVDYLLCNTNVKEVNNIEISKKIGLNDNAINILSNFNVKDAWQLDRLYGTLGNYQDFSTIINKIVENENFEALIYFIKKYINSFIIEKLNKQKVLYTDTETNNDITTYDLLRDAQEQGVYEECRKYKESSTDIYAYKINSLFTSIINSITKELKPLFSKRWTLNDDKTEVVPVCTDGSEKLSLLNNYGGVKYNGSTRTNKK